MAPIEMTWHSTGECRGVTILELVVVLAVMAILLSIAVPTYRQYAQRGERADAIRVMLAVAGCQERIRLIQGSYDTTRGLDQAEISSYRIRVEPAENTASSVYMIVASPLQTADNSCGALSLDHTGARRISLQEGSPQSCWNGR